VCVCVRLLVNMLNNYAAEPSCSTKCGELIASRSEPLASPADQLVSLCFVEFRTFILRSCRSRTANFLCTHVGERTEHSQFHMYKVAEPRRADLS
jgi:hypothetical protein